VIVPAALVALSVVGAAPVVTVNEAGLVTELVTAALGAEPRFEVLSSADVRRQLEIEADRRTLGCDENAQSCLAEIAGAMGAQLVVYGKLGALGDVIILTLNLFDSSQGKAVGRTVVKEPSLAKVSERVDGAVKELIAPYLAKLGADGKAKLLVLDVEAPKGAPEGAPAPPPEPVGSGPPMLTLVGGGIAVVGVLSLVGGGGALGVAALADGEADDVTLSEVKANDAYDRRDLFGTIGAGGLTFGAVAALAGVALAVFGVMSASDEAAPDEAGPNERGPNEGAPHEGAPREAATEATP
jgi:hypothetical protein